MSDYEADDNLMPKREWAGITRLKDPLKGLRAIFNKFFDRTADAKRVHGVMDTSIAAIIREAQTLQAGMSHLNEIYSDSQEISNELAHLTTYVINLPSTIAGDAGYWSYALDLVQSEVFEEGAESVNLEQLQDLSQALDRVIAHKQEYRDRAKDTGISH